MNDARLASVREREWGEKRKKERKRRIEKKERKQDPDLAQR